MTKRLKEINLEYRMPSVADAISVLRKEIDMARTCGVGCLYVIHGYGSSGTGGKICTEVRRVLTVMKSSGKIKNYIKGEDFNIFNFEALALKNSYAGLEGLLHVCNHGVTVIEI